MNQIPGCLMNAGTGILLLLMTFVIMALVAYLLVLVIKIFRRLRGRNGE